MTAKIVVIGGSFGGLTTAYELRRKLGPERARITLIAKDPRFVFVPSLPWVAMGHRTVEQISFELAEPLARKRVDFALETVQHIDPGAKSVKTDRAEHGYDFLVVATGHRSANEAVAGLGPFTGPGHSSDVVARSRGTPLPPCAGCWMSLVRSSWAPHLGQVASARLMSSRSNSTTCCARAGCATRCRSRSSPPSRSSATWGWAARARSGNCWRARSTSATSSTGPLRRSPASVPTPSRWTGPTRSRRCCRW